MRRADRPQDPRLPNDLPQAAAIDAAADLQLRQLTLQGDFSDQRLPGLEVEEAHIVRTSFVGADLADARLVDVVVEGSDFSGADLHGASFSRVAFVDCRMSGVQIAQARLHNVRFAECKLNGANFRMSEADRILFDHVNLRGAEFSAGHLTCACFFDSDLGGAEFSQTVMPRARFHGSSLADIRGGEYLKDIVIDTSQVLPLALRVFAGLGIRVTDERDDPEAAKA